MSAVTITNVTINNNPSKFTDPFELDISFECLSELKEDLEFKLIYVGSAEDEKADQILDCILVGPVPVGNSRFTFKAPAPNPSLIPKEDLLGVTVLLLIVSYEGNEFTRIGYYVNNELRNDENNSLLPSSSSSSQIAETNKSTKEEQEDDDDEADEEGDESIEEVPIQKNINFVIEDVSRNILADKPRVTRIPIKWNDQFDETRSDLISTTVNEEAMIEDEEEVNFEDEEEDLLDDDDDEDESVESDENETEKAKNETLQSEEDATMMDEKLFFIPPMAKQAEKKLRKSNSQSLWLLFGGTLLLLLLSGIFLNMEEIFSFSFLAASMLGMVFPSAALYHMAMVSGIDINSPGLTQ